MNESDIRKIEEIIRLHDEAFENYQKCPQASWKSSEGAIEISFGNYWDRLEGRQCTVHVYSYAFSNRRMLYFSSIDEALEEVTKWHHTAMSHTDHSRC